MKYDLDEMAASVDRLPLPSPAAITLIQLCSEETVSITDITRVISSDQGLTAQVLRVANSSYFNYPRRIDSINRAVVILGFRQLTDIALSFAFSSFSRGLSLPRRFNPDALWQHALLTATTARVVARFFHSEKENLAYTGGLLHDIGKLVLAQVAGDDYLKLQELPDRADQRLYVMEEKTFGFHHGDVGGILIDRWNLPLALVNMVTYHHYLGDFSGDPGSYKLLEFVYLSNLLAHYVQQNWQTMADIEAYDANFSHYFQIEAAAFTALIDSVHGDIQKNALLRMMQPS